MPFNNLRICYELPDGDLHINFEDPKNDMLRYFTPGWYHRDIGNIYDLSNGYIYNYIDRYDNYCISYEWYEINLIIIRSHNAM